MIETEFIETTSALLELRSDYLYIAFKEDAVVELEHVIENKKVRERIQRGKKMLVLGDIRKVWSVTKEAQGYLSSKEVTDLNIAMAILTKSLTTVLLANFFITFNKPAVPTKLFKNEEKAIKWLRSFKNDNL